MISHLHGVCEDAVSGAGDMVLTCVHRSLLIMKVPDFIHGDKMTFDNCYFSLKHLWFETQLYFSLGH